MSVIPLLPPGAPLWFPPVEEASEDGVLAAGGDLSPERLVLAYASGIFPWYDKDSPILWWSPDPRAVLWPEQFHLSRSMKRFHKTSPYRVTINYAVLVVFDENRDNVERG